MKFCGMNGPSESEVESLLMSPCWSQTTQNGTQDQYLLDGHKLLLDHDLETQLSDTDNNKSSLDVLDNLLLNTSSLNTSLSELKPLPPFTGYTGHLSINGISGHHYHAIAQRLPDDSNNNFSQSAYVTTPINSNSGNGSCGPTTLSDHHNIVSSSTCLPDSVLNSDGGGGGGGGGGVNNGTDNVSCITSDVKLFSDSQLDNKLYSVADSCLLSDQSVRIYADAKDLSEYVDMNSIDDIAAIIGSAIADTTVPNQLDHEDNNDTRESWMDLDAWIDGNCIQQDGKLIVSQQDTLNEFILPHSPATSSNNNNNNNINNNNSGSTLQNLLSHGYMPLLQNRLQNGPPIKGETPSSTSYCNELTSSTSISPPGSVVSTTDNLMMNGRYIGNSQQYSNAGLKSDGLCSPDLMGNYPHTTTITPTTGKQKRPRNQKKQQQQQHGQMSGGANQMTAVSPSSVSFNTNDLSGLLGKEKPVHRCSICNRGFLNKSNIKVHLRTHTGEKPFRCDVCAKAFRQKAHLLKHQQIHKRIGRD